MKYKRLAIIASFLFASICLPIQTLSANLMQAYYQALDSDPTFKKAQSDWESAKQNLPITRAAYLTQLAITGNVFRQFNNTVPPIVVPNANGYNYNYGFVVSASQPIFNLAAWDAIKSAHAAVKSVTATYAAAGQDLMLRTVRAYVAVLQAYDKLRYTLARKRAVYEQLLVARERFKVGLIAITGVYDARSSYDQSVATSISNQKEIDDAVEQLAEITGKRYTQMQAIGKRVLLMKPVPNNIDTWTDVAGRQNYSLIAENYAVIAARETLKQQSVSWMPQLNAQAQWTNANQTSIHQEETGLLGIGVLPGAATNNLVYGLSLDFPLIQGGVVRANTRQAHFNFISASNEREFIYRRVVSDTRQSFLGIITGISKVNADWQSVISAQNALDATKAGYEIGTRTMVDVLDDVTSLYLRQQQYADDQYFYILDTIELKYNAGTLSLVDLKKINSWLDKRVKISLSVTALKSHLKPIKRFPNVPNAKRNTFPKKQRERVASSGVLVNQPILALPRPLVTQAQSSPNKNLPLPKQTQSHTSKVSKKPIVKKSLPKKTASLDDQVIPLYEGPSTKDRALPSPL